MEQPSNEEARIIWTNIKLANLLEELSRILDDNLGSMPKRAFWYDAQDAYNGLRKQQHALADTISEWIGDGRKAK